MRRAGIRDNVPEPDRGEVTHVPFHAVINHEFRAALDVVFRRDPVLLVLDAVGEHGTGASLRDLHVIVDIEESAVAGDAHLLRADPLGPAPAGPHQARLEPGGCRLQQRVLSVPDLDLPEIPGRAAQRSSFVRNVERGVGADHTGIIDQRAGPQVLLRERHHHPVGALQGTDAVGTHLPAEIRTGLVNAQRRLQGLGAQVDNLSSFLVARQEGGCKEQIDAQQ